MVWDAMAWDLTSLGPLPAVILLVTGVVVMSRWSRDRYVRQRGSVRARARRRLDAKVDGWPDGSDDGVVRWHDFAELTKQDVVDLLWDRGWFYRGQDMDADGWPLFVTRDPRAADPRWYPSARSGWPTTGAGRPPGSGSAEVRPAGPQERR